MSTKRNTISLAEITTAHEAMDSCDIVLSMSTDEDWTPTLKTAEDHPDHWWIGRYATCGDWLDINGGKQLIYWCDSYQDNLGFWMIRVGEDGEVLRGEGARRTNISTRAPKRTFRRVYNGPLEIKARPTNFDEVSDRVVDQ